MGKAQQADNAKIGTFLTEAGRAKKLRSQQA
jgi:hypothetical protein